MYVHTLTILLEMETFSLRWKGRRGQLLSLEETWQLQSRTQLRDTKASSQDGQEHVRGTWWGVHKERSTSWRGPRRRPPNAAQIRSHKQPDSCSLFALLKSPSVSLVYRCYSMHTHDCKCMWVMYLVPVCESVENIQRLRGLITANRLNKAHQQKLHSCPSKTQSVLHTSCFEHLLSLSPSLHLIPHLLW